MTSIREATVNDLPVVDALAESAIGTPQPTQATYITQADSKRLILVAEHDREVVGMISVGPPREALPSISDRGPIPFENAPWWKIYALATSTPRAGTGTALLRAAHQRLPRRMRGFYGNVAENRHEAIAFYRSSGFFLAPSINLEGPHGIPVLMKEDPGDLFFVAPRQRLFQPAARWEERHADQLMRREIAVGQKIKERSDVGYRTWLREAAVTAHAACGHDRLGPRPLITFAYDPDHRLWCTSCKTAAIDIISRHPLMNEDEVLCDGCHRHDHTTESGWAYDESRRLIGYAYLCSACRAR